jgi:hypothetical protein
VHRLERNDDPDGMTFRQIRDRMNELEAERVGNVKLANGIAVSVVTGLDDHSRFCVMAKVVARATARPVCDALLEALNSHGIPEQILTDIQTQVPRAASVIVRVGGCPACTLGRIRAWGSAGKATRFGRPLRGRRTR